MYNVYPKLECFAHPLFCLTVSKSLMHQICEHEWSQRIFLYVSACKDFIYRQLLSFWKASVHSLSGGHWSIYKTLSRTNWVGNHPQLAERKRTRKGHVLSTRRCALWAHWTREENLRACTSHYMWHKIIIRKSVQSCGGTKQWSLSALHMLRTTKQGFCPFCAEKWCFPRGTTHWRGGILL